jgi:hypothetical protein
MPRRRVAATTRKALQDLKNGRSAPLTNDSVMPSKYHKQPRSSDSNSTLISITLVFQNTTSQRAGLSRPLCLT